MKMPGTCRHFTAMTIFSEHRRRDTPAPAIGDERNSRRAWDDLLVACLSASWSARYYVSRMTHRANALVGFLTAITVAGWQLPPVHGQSSSTLEGAWTLNRSISELPREIGFNPAWVAASPDGQNAGAPGGGGGRGRRGSGAGAPSGPRPESYEDAQRRDALVAEARNPPARLTIVDTPSAITITTELGQSRIFHPDLREETIQVDRASVSATTTREANRLVIVYHASATRQVRYTYSRSANPSQLVVEIQLLDHGAGDKARRIYEPAGAGTEAARPHRSFVSDIRFGGPVIVRHRRSTAGSRVEGSEPSRNCR